MKPQEAPSKGPTNTTVFAAEDKIASIFQPDTLVSEQYFDDLRRRTVLEPERRLVLAVLEDAISCYQHYFFSRNPIHQRLFEEAKEWILSADDSWVFSFESVCDALEVNAAYLRQGLLRWKPKATALQIEEPKRMVV
jgi:hypothetical protein